MLQKTRMILNEVRSTCEMTPVTRRPLSDPRSDPIRNSDGRLPLHNVEA